MLRWDSRRYRKRAGWVAGGILLLALIAYVVAQAVAQAGRGDGNDFTSYLLASRALFQGHDPYQIGSPFPYIYPLLLAFVLAPLAWLPVQLAAFFWTLLLLAALTGSVRLLDLSHRERQVPAVWWIALCIVLFDVIQNNLVNGQVNLLVLFACLSAWAALRSRRDGRAALLTGAAIALKVFPLVLILPLLVRGRWRLAAGTLAVALALCALPGVVPGVDLGRSYGEYARGFLGAQIGGVPGASKGVDFTVVGMLRQSGVPVGRMTAFAVGSFLTVLLLVWDVVWCRRRGRDLTAHAFSLYLLLPLFVVPVPQVHHLIMALPAQGVLLALSIASPGRPGRLMLAASLGTYLLASLLWREGPLYFVSLALLAAGIMLAMPLYGGGCVGHFVSILISTTPKEKNEMATKQQFTTEQAREIGDKLGIEWTRFDVEQFRMGLNVELEHGLRSPSTDVTGNVPITTGKIALAHLNEFPDYYTRLKTMEQEARKEQG